MAQFKSNPMMRSLAAAVHARVPVMLKGDPGEGKSSLIENAAAQWGRHCETVVGSSREATDYLGVMTENESGYIGYSPFEWVNRLNSAEAGILFLDELNRAPRLTMNAMLRVLQERHVGDTALGENVAIIAAANPPETNPEVEELSSAAANRLMHLDWVFDRDSWMENVSTDFDNVSYDDLSDLTHSSPKTRMAIIGSEIAGFHRHDLTALNPGVPKDPVQATGAWASPRSWHNLVRVASHLQEGDDEALMLCAKGLVGQDMAVKFMAWRSTADLYNPMDVLEDPSIVSWTSDRPDRLFVLVKSIEAIAAAEPEHWKRAVQVMILCAEGGKPDVALPSVQHLLNSIPQGQRIPARDRLDAAFDGLLSRTSHSLAVAA